MHFERISSVELLKSYAPVSLPEKMKAEITVMKQNKNITSMHVSVYTHTHVTVYNLQLRGTRHSFIFYNTPSCSRSLIPGSMKRKISFGIQGGRIMSPLK